MKNYSALIVDDHPMISEACKMAFLKISSINKTIKFNIDIAYDCDSAIKIINKSKKLNIALLDIKIPPSKDLEFLTGEDLGKLIKKKFPRTKIIILTTYNDNFVIKNILRNINPKSLLIKNDINSEELVFAINKAVKNQTYYSKSVLEIMQDKISTTYLLDKKNRRILYEISLIKTNKEISDIMGLTTNEFYNRKRKLYNIFGIKNRNDRKLILEAKNKGFI
ncbi:MAG: response regulator transcription factor [Flavobacteriaceae bacterium]|nr:response regulator transcription factor [Flavobacteriaceae bacterium]